MLLKTKSDNKTCEMYDRIARAAHSELREFFMSAPELEKRVSADELGGLVRDAIRYLDGEGGHPRWRNSNGTDAPHIAYGKQVAGWVIGKLNALPAPAPPPPPPGSIQARLAAVEARLAAVEGRLDRIEGQMAVLKDQAVADPGLKVRRAG